MVRGLDLVCYRVSQRALCKIASMTVLAGPIAEAGAEAVGGRKSHDKTTHGREVITVGIPVALQDHMTWCPQCKGHFKILPANSSRTHQGKAVAYHDDPTECGSRLIASL